MREVKVALGAPEKARHKENGVRKSAVMSVTRKR